MNKALPISRLIKVDVNLAPKAAQFQNISTLLILGTSGVINNVEKIRTYNSIDAVAFDFGTTAPEYLAALLWFQQSPQPAELKIGNWNARQSHAKLVGAPLNTAQQLLSNFTAVTSGYFAIDIDGVGLSFSRLDFSAQTNLNGIAAVLGGALGGYATVVWNANTSNFVVTALSQGAASSIGFFKAPVTGGSFKFNAQPALNDSISFFSRSLLLNFKSPAAPLSSSMTDITIGATLAQTVANTLAVFQYISTNQGGIAANASNNYTFAIDPADNTRIIVTALVGSTSDTINVFTGTFANTVNTITALPAGNSTYGLFGNTVTNSGAYLVQGAEAQTPVSAVVDYDNNFGQSFYGLTVLGTTDLQTIDISNFIEAANNKHIFAVSTTEAGVIVAASTSDIAAQLKALNLKRTLVQYSSVNPYAAVSLLARILTTDYNANNSVITLMYKQEPGIVAELLSATEIGVLESKNANVFVAYNNNTAIVEQGKMCNGYFVDEVTGTDWLALEIQNDIFNALYTSTTKIPQTDSGVHVLITLAENACAKGVINGLLAPGIWNAGGFGSLSQGDFMAKGFYVYASSVNDQSTAQRALRKSPPIQVAAKLAGAIHNVDVIINVNR